MISKKQKKVYRFLNHNEHSLILISTITGFVSIFVFAFLVGGPIGITSSATGLITCVITAGIKKHRLINKKNKKSYDTIISLSKSKSNSIKVLISKALIDSYIVMMSLF